MEIFGWSAGKGGCQFYRLDAPYQAVQERYGWDISVSEQMKAEIMVGTGNVDTNPKTGELITGHDPDVLVMQRACKPDSSRLFQFKMNQGHSVGVCEFDDNLWEIDDLNYAKAYYNNPEFMGALAQNLDMADAITVSTDALAHQIINFQPAANGKVYIMPNQLPDWSLPLPQREHHDGSERPVVIGYPASRTIWEMSGWSATPSRS